VPLDTAQGTVEGLFGWGGGWGGGVPSAVFVQTRAAHRQTLSARLISLCAQPGLTGTNCRAGVNAVCARRTERRDGSTAWRRRGAGRQKAATSRRRRQWRRTGGQEDEETEREDERGVAKRRSGQTPTI
jgi:hypothetical protein